MTQGAVFGILIERLTGQTIERQEFPENQPWGSAEKEIKKPASWELMIKLAEKLSEGIPQVRVDLYDVFGQVYFGELTFFHFGGKKPFYPEKWDYVFGSWIDLPDKG